MENIKITVGIGNNEVTREFVNGHGFEYDSDYWGAKILDMLDTIEKSNEPFKEIPGFEGTLEKLNEF